MKGGLLLDQILQSSSILRNVSVITSKHVSQNRQ